MSTVGTMFMSTLRWIGESVAAVADLVSPISSQTRDDDRSASVSGAFHGTWNTSSSNVPHLSQPPPAEFPVEMLRYELPGVVDWPVPMRESQPTPAPVAVDWAEERRRHAREMFLQFKVKVRDFAYESTLPPVPPARYGRRRGKATEVALFRGPRPLKRTRRDEFDEMPERLADGAMSSVDDRPTAPKRRRLQRVPTEPVIESQGMTATGSQLPLAMQSPAGDSQGATSQPSGHRPAPHTVDLPPCAMDVGIIDLAAGTPSSCPASLKPSGWVTTPPITPRGSYATLGFSLPQLSQLAIEQPIDVNGPLMSGFRAPVPSIGTAQGACRTRSPILDEIRSSTALSELSSLSSLPSLRSTPSCTVNRSKRPVVHQRRPSLRDISSSYNALPTPPNPVSSELPRYALRARTPKTSSRSTPASQTPHRKGRSSFSKQTSTTIKSLPSMPLRRSPRNTAVQAKAAKARITTNKVKVAKTTKSARR
jgi:hypothetical protein